MKTLKGGEFLIKEINAEDIFIPEDFNEEQRMMADTCKDFINKEVMPKVDELDKHNPELLKKLLKQAGELGLLGISIPEEYEGFGQDFVTSMLTLEEIGRGYSFAVCFSAHTGIGTLPILYYGNSEQKKKYVTKLATGELVGAYCLTEPGAGSDANSGKTKAVLDKGGKNYILNGVKMWITNGGIADIHIVFAKIGDDKNLSAFIVESAWKGIVLGAEEEKMGIKGSSTLQIYYNDVKVPAENLLGERGGGFKIALNILNIGRMKLGIATVGASKEIITNSVIYANERKQFGTQIANFGAIKHKIAQMTILTFAGESLTYRASRNVEEATQEYIAKGQDKEKATIEGLRQFAVEAAISKIFCSEALDFVADEGVQIFGGMGYSAETTVERAYRDSRINRIFEGTNEINRMVIVGEILKRAFKGELDVLTPAKKVGKELLGIPDFGSNTTDYFELKKRTIINFKKTILMVAGAGIKEFKNKIAHEQELLMLISDMLINTYAAESTLLRVEKLSLQNKTKNLDLYKDMLDVFVYDAASKIKKYGDDAVNYFAEGNEKLGMAMGMKRFTKTEAVNTISARRRITDKIIEMNKYPF